MANLNRVLLIGNLTRDPESRTTPKGSVICQFGLAVNREFKGADGQKREETTFLDIEAWGKQAETIAKHCTKGRSLFVEGRLRFDSWDDKQTGAKRSKLTVVLESFQFIGGREAGDSAANSGSSTRSEGQGTNQGARSPGNGEDYTEDVPF